MIDVHCHILPEVDDGAESMQQAINMAKIAQEEGIIKMIATPHYHPEFKYEKGEELKRIRERFKKELKENNIDIEIYLGNEIYFTYDLMDKISELDFYCLNDSKYIKDINEAIGNYFTEEKDIYTKDINELKIDVSQEFDFIKITVTV